MIMHYDPPFEGDDDDGDADTPFDDDYVWDEDMPSWGGF